MSSTRSAFITGITGQDGAYLTHLLRAKGYRVCGAVRALKAPHEYSNLHALGVADAVEYHHLDLADVNAVRAALKACAPDEIYHLAAQSSVGESLQAPLQTAHSTAMTSANLLEAWREEMPHARLFIASSSEIFGAASNANATGAPLSEATPFAPRNPYGAAKLYAHSLAVAYRESFGMHASCGILFNHESPLRGEKFVTRKVTRAVARIKLGLQQELHLGDLSVMRDWGFAGDYVCAMWRMLQQDEPRDYVVATGQAHALSDFVSHAFASVGLDWQDYVRVDQSLLRRAENAAVVGDASLASTRLGWKPRLSLGELLHLMVQADMRREQDRADEIDYFGEKETP